MWIEIEIRRWIILLKLIYSLLFVCLTILTYLNESVHHSNDQYSFPISKIWFSFIVLILLASLLCDRLNRENFLSLKIFEIIEYVLFIFLILLVIFGKHEIYFHFKSKFVFFKGHIQIYSQLYSSLSLEDFPGTTYISIILIDICPISISMYLLINSMKKGFCHRISPEQIISSV